MASRCAQQRQGWEVRIISGVAAGYECCTHLHAPCLYHLPPSCAHLLPRCSPPPPQVDKVTQRHRHMPNGRPLPAAAAEERASYFYADRWVWAVMDCFRPAVWAQPCRHMPYGQLLTSTRTLPNTCIHHAAFSLALCLLCRRTHPNDRGHQVLAELLAGLVLGAAHEQQRQQGAGKAEQHAAWAQRSTKVQQALTAIPPPMIPGNAEEPTSLCAIQVRLADAAAGHRVGQARC